MLPIHASTSLLRQCARPMPLKVLVARCRASRSIHHNSIYRLSSTAAEVRGEADASSSPSSSSAVTRPIDPSKLFDQVDGDKDGTIDKHEFLTALQMVNYENVMKAQEQAKENLNRLTRKMATVEKLEQYLADLESNHELKQQAYNNIGMSTAAEIDALFAESKLKKDHIKDSIRELKSMIHEARAIFNSVTKQQQ